MLKAGTAARRRSIRWNQAVEAETVRHGVEQLLRELDRRLQERDPNWVGHCKLLVTSGHGTAYASITAAGDQPRWAGAAVATNAVELTIYVALYGWSDGDVALALDSLLEEEPVLAVPDRMIR